MSGMDESNLYGGHMKIKLNMETAAKLWMFGLIVTPYILRNRFLPEIVAAGNYISLLGIILVCYKINNRTDIYEKITFFCVISAFLIYTFHFPSRDTFLKNVQAIFLPIIVLRVARIDKQKGKTLFKIALKFFDIMACILLLNVAADIVTGRAASLWFASFYEIPSLWSMIRLHRLVSYFGHSLNSMLFILSYFILHILDSMYISKKENLLMPTIISLVVIAATGSKTGLIVILAAILVGYGDKKMIKYIPFMALAMYMLQRYGVLDLVRERFVDGMEKGDLTTGRISSLTSLTEKGTLKFYYFKSQDGKLINSSVAMVAALENPILRWAFRDGIIFATLMTIGVLFAPFFRIMKIGTTRITLLSLIFLITINTFDTICTIGDSMILCCTMMVLFTISARIALEQPQ